MPKQYRLPPNESRIQREKREAFWIRKALDKMTLIEKVLATDEDLRAAAEKLKREYQKAYRDRYKTLKEESSHDR